MSTSYLNFLQQQHHRLSYAVLRRSFQKKFEQNSGMKLETNYGKIVSGQTVTLLQLQEEQTLKH